MSHSWYLVIAGCVLVGMLLGAIGCGGSSQNFRIRQRPLEPYPDTPAGMENLRRSYFEEHAYLHQRRRDLQLPAPEPGRNLVGLALSGGGIRSASYSLGVLQALHEHGLFDRIDLTSATSGGAYLLGWVEAHYGAKFEAGEELNELGWSVVAEDLQALLSERNATRDPPNDHLAQLRQHARFLNPGGFAPGLLMIWSYVWRLPIALVLDVGLHVKGKINFHHLTSVYRRRIADTYLHGRSDVKLAQVNDEPARTPYAIINGTLANTDFRDALETKHNFEFTRDQTGSDGLGYVETVAFDRPVRNVKRENGKAIEVAIRGQADVARSLDLSWAIAASGAAVDPDAMLAGENLGTRFVGATVGSALNLALGYETHNYARWLSGWSSIFDYFRMLTWQRVLPLELGARWIKVTDGGHFDNTSIFALLRRGVSTIIAVEAGADPDSEFADRRRLRELVEGRLGIDRLPEKKWESDEVVLTRNEARVARIIFLKPHTNFCDPESLEPSAPEDTKICRYDQRPGELSELFRNDFPHTSTLRQWFDLETFEAYRLLGRRMASARLTATTLGLTSP